MPASEVSAGATGFVLRKKKAKDKTAPKNEYEAAIAIQDGNATRELTGFMKAERDAQIKAAKIEALKQYGYFSDESSVNDVI